VNSRLGICPCRSNSLTATDAGGLTGKLERHP